MPKLSPRQLAALESRDEDSEENLAHDYASTQEDEDARRRRFRKLQALSEDQS